MNKLISWLENSFAPKMNKINHNVWVVAVKDSILQTLPFIFLGSLFCLLTIPGDMLGIANYPDFWVPYRWTMGIVSIIVSFLIPFNLMEKKRLRKQRIIAGFSGMILFYMIITPQLVADNSVGFGHSAFGAGGMFLAIFAGIITGIIMNAFGKFSFFKEESVIPDFVKAWFDSMLPVGTVICIGWIGVFLLNIDVYNIVLNIFMPLQKIYETPFGFTFVTFLYGFLYSMGISTWVLAPVTYPIIYAAIAENVAGTALNVGTTTPLNVLFVGGMGFTLPLVIMMMFSKSKRLKALGRASLVPGVFNINEPVVFGAVAWNPIMMLPMWIVAIVVPFLYWTFLKIIPLVAIPTIQFEMWYLPYPFSAWLASNDFAFVLLIFVLGLVATAIWFPFFKAFERQCVEEELNERKEEKA